MITGPDNGGDIPVHYQTGDAWVLLSLMIASGVADGERVNVKDIMAVGAFVGGKQPSNDELDASMDRLYEGGWASVKDDGTYSLTYNSLNSWRGAVSHQPNAQTKLELVEQILGLREQEDWNG